MGHIHKKFGRNGKVLMNMNMNNASSQQFTGSTAKPLPLFGIGNTTLNAASIPAAAEASETSLSSFGGPPSIGQKHAFGGFGPNAGPSSNVFQQTQSAIGSSTFHSSNPTVSRQSAFASITAFGPTSMSESRSTGSTIGVSSSPAFWSGSEPSSTFTFSSSSTPGFAKNHSLFRTFPAPSGAQTTRPSFGRTVFDGLRKGSKIAAYVPTTEVDRKDTKGAGKLKSISAMPVYGNISHEELRWEDFQLRDKDVGGLSPDIRSMAEIGIRAAVKPSNPFGPSPGQPCTKPLLPLTSPNPFAPKIPSVEGSSYPSFISSPLISSTSFNPASIAQSNPFTLTSSFPPLSSASTMHSNPFGPSPGQLSPNPFAPKIPSVEGSSNPSFISSSLISSTSFNHASITQSNPFTLTSSFPPLSSTSTMHSNPFGPSPGQPCTKPLLPLTSPNPFAPKISSVEGSSNSSFISSPLISSTSFNPASITQSNPFTLTSSFPPLSSTSTMHSNPFGPSPGQPCTKPLLPLTYPNPFAPKTPSVEGSSNPSFSSSPHILSTSFNPASITQSNPFTLTSSFPPLSSTSTMHSNPFGPSPGQPCTKPLLPLTYPNPFAPKTPSVEGSSNPSFISSPHILSTSFNPASITQSNPFTLTSSFPPLSSTSTMHSNNPFGPSPTLGQLSTNPLFSPAPASSTSPALSSASSVLNTQAFPLVQSAPSLGQSTSPSFLNSNVYTTPSIVSRSPSLHHTSNQAGVGQVTVTPITGISQLSPVTNPYGTLPAMPRMSVGRSGSTPIVQYGISSMPVTDKPACVRNSTLVTSRHLSQGRIRLPARKYNPKTDCQKVPFFIDEELHSLPKACATFIPRENPRALIIGMTGWCPPRSNTNKISLLNDIGNSDKSSTSEGQTNLNVKPNGVCDDEYISTTLPVDRSSEAPPPIMYEPGADVESMIPKLHDSEYYTEPCIEELTAKEKVESGFCCHVKDFVVGRYGYGCIKFLGQTDVRQLDLESIVQFNNREVIVYMDESTKPPVGQGLNKPAEITLLNIKCLDKKTGTHWTDGAKVDKYKKMLIKKSKDQGAEFVSYNPIIGEWKFSVQHF